MTEPKPCTVKGCKATGYHHHDVCNSAEITACNGPGCCFAFGDWFTPMAAAPKPRPSRKALAARLAAVEAENADLHAEIADKADRLARLEADPDAAVIEAMSAAMYAARADFDKALYSVALPWCECTARTQDTYRASARAALKAAREAGAL